MESARRNIYLDLIENLPVAAVYLIDGKLYLNKKASALTGYGSDDLSTIDDWFKIYGDQESFVRSIYENAKANNFKEINRVVFPKKNGEMAIVDFSASLIPPVEVWVMIDVTEKLLIEERFTVLFDHSTDAHLLFDESGIIDCNNAAVKMLNAKSKEDLLACHPAIFSPEFQPCGTRSLEKNKIMDQLARDRGYHRFEWTHKKLTGEEFLVEVTLNPVLVANKKMLLVVWHDLTDIKEAQKKLEEERSLNFHAAKMATLGEMASGVAHEINNPLTIILNRAQQIDKYLNLVPPNIEESQNSAKKILATVERISKVIKALRNFARDGKEDTLEKTKLEIVISETLDLCQERFATNGISLKLIPLPDSSILNFHISCARIQLEQVFLNILNNAFDAVEGMDNSTVEVQVYKEGTKTICIAIEDSGIGIPKDIKDKIMEPFFTTKAIGKGTGIGLSISKGIIEKHNGQLFLDGTSKNTRFIIKLPLVP